AGSVYQLFRSGGGGPGFTSGVGALRGATQSAPNKPGKSNPAAFLAAARWASIVSAAGCAEADAKPRATGTANAKAAGRSISNSQLSVPQGRGCAGLPTGQARRPQLRLQHHRQRRPQCVALLHHSELRINRNGG